MRLTLNDVAREAGVSTATTDRVLNNRTGVRGRTREIVIDAARRLGYISETWSSVVADPYPTALQPRLHFVLPQGTNMFVQTLQQQLQTQAEARGGAEVCVTQIEGFNPENLARALAELEGRADGVGIVALDHPTVREAVGRLSNAGVKVVTLASDILHVPRVAYVGVDNRAAGRLAGYVLGRFLGASEPRKIALFAGSLSYRGHEEREMGFRNIIKEDFPNLEVVALREMQDDKETAFAEAVKLLRSEHNIEGIYNIGAGNEGIARAMKEYPSKKGIVYIAHDLTPHNRACLLDGTIDAIIDQNPRVEAREAINILIESVKGRPYEYHPPRLHIIFRENLPES